ncbi:hypothetical protein EDD17DRAFT_1711602 [Pisolithus thermaeus]|nr:hypothetical protein EDD17DRAFT_1711602 [Pisolithus thermaeus]
MSDSTRNARTAKRAVVVRQWSKKLISTLNFRTRESIALHKNPRHHHSKFVVSGATISGPTYTKKFILTYSTSSVDVEDIPVPEIPQCTDSLSDELLPDIPRCPRGAGDHPLLVWHSEFQEIYLQELLRLEGRGDCVDVCAECNTNSPLYCCRDCFGGRMLCQECAVLGHALTPLHCLECWNGTFFQKTSLKSLGLRIQLGHAPGQTCGNPKRAFNDDFTVLDSHGIHAVAIDYCDCESAKSLVQQLLRVSWFPATTVNPRSATTFRLLQEFQLLSFESKVSAYEFYHSLARNSDNNGVLDIKGRYESFIRSVREWRHLKMLKWSGRGHDPAGIVNTSSGECAVLCPACPHPGINLPDGWESSPPHRKWLYADFVAIDANFRLKRKHVSSDAIDPSLSDGWGYFVEDSQYRTFLNERRHDIQEKSTCSSHNAVNMADTKSSQGLATTGVSSIVCVRHNFKYPNGVVDLEKGERYANMDYAFFSAMRHSSCNVLNVSYDIACQWHKNLWARMLAFPPALQLQHTIMNTHFFVPKFHLPAHIAKCHTLYSFNFLPGVGRTDGEAPERGWSSINPVASSTKEMGPGSRRDTLDDYFGDWNWKKLTGLGAILLRKLKDAICESAEYQAVLQELEDALMHDEPKAFAEWKEEVYAWEADPSKTNPFDPKVETLTQAAIHLQLARDDVQALRDGTQVILHDNVSPSMLIASGLDLEEQQRRLSLDKASLGLHVSDRQEGLVFHKISSLQRRIDLWTAIQQLYMPVVSIIRQRLSTTSLGTDQPEDYALCLPSAVVAASGTCDKMLMEHEWKLRHAQAHDALHSLRQTLRYRSYILKFKDRHLTGQGANTRACATLKKIEAKITIVTQRYQAAHAALCSLVPYINKTGWQATLRSLRPDDIHSMTDMLGMETEGTRTFSWIWKVHGASRDEGDRDGSLDAMRIEWCKARARANRWTEEVELLMEEMRRTDQFLKWHASWWTERINILPVTDNSLAEGLIAYAHRQASLRHSLKDRFHSMWSSTLAGTNYLGFSTSFTQSLSQESGVYITADATIT